MRVGVDVARGAVVGAQPRVNVVVVRGCDRRDSVVAAAAVRAARRIGVRGDEAERADLGGESSRHRYFLLFGLPTYRPVPLAGLGPKGVFGSAVAASQLGRRRAASSATICFMADPAPTRETIEALVRAINDHDIERILGFYEETITNHGRPAGRDEMRAVHTLIFTTFPDWRLEVDDLVTTSDRAVVRGRLCGTHSRAVPSPADQFLFGGALRGVEPAGRRFDVAAMHLWELAANGTVTAHWAVRDDLTLRRQATGESQP